MNPPTPDQLLRRVMAGDQGSLGQLLEAHQHRLFNVCFRMVGNRDDAAEVTQDAMLKIIEHIHDFHGDSDIGTWMVRITMNLSISHLRKRKLRRTASLDTTPDNGHGDDQGVALREQMADVREPGPVESVQQGEMIAFLHQAMGLLDDEFRSVLVLRDIEEMDYQHIASVLAVPVGTVKSRLFRARLALRQQMLRLCPTSARMGEKRAPAPEGLSHG